MAQTFNPKAEKQAASKATRKLKASFKTAIKRSANVTPGGEASKATVRAKYRGGRLDRLTFQAPHYIFKQNYGFEGVKSNGVSMRLRATSVLSKSIADANVLENLADELGNLRAEAIEASITFKL